MWFNLMDLEEGSSVDEELLKHVVNGDDVVHARRKILYFGSTEITNPVISRSCVDACWKNVIDYITSHKTVGRSLEKQVEFTWQELYFSTEHQLLFGKGEIWVFARGKKKFGMTGSRQLLWTNDDTWEHKHLYDDFDHRPRCFVIRASRKAEVVPSLDPYKGVAVVDLLKVDDQLGDTFQFVY